MERPPAPRWWNDARGRALFYQAALLAGLGGLAWFLIANTLANLEARHIATGFAFLGQEAAFGIGEHLIPYSAADSYLRAFVVGLLNTLEVSALGILFCTLLGGLIGAARLSPNPLVRALAGGYVEAVRNVPLLLQLLLWYALITEGLPAPRQALALFDSVFLSNRGLKLPVPLWAGATPALCLAVVAAVLAVMALAWAARRIRARSGRQLPTVRLAAALLIGLPLAAFLAAGAELPLERPRLAGFNFTGGVTLSPEFAALLFGLTVYTAAFVAEIVRGGILAVPPGQTEAALALGLSRGRVLRLVVLPQALRVVVPPLTSQYLNLTKNSTLAVAIGYPDLVSVGNTAINQTGQAVEGVAILMAVYLTLSLGLSLAMNRFNARVALRGGKR